MVVVVVDLLEEVVEQMSLEAGVELRGPEEVEVAMGVDQVEDSCFVLRFPSHRLSNGRSYCKQR